MVVFCLLLSLSSSSRAHLRVVCVTVAKREKEVKIFFGFRPFFLSARKKWEKRGASLSFARLHKKTTLFKTQKKNGLSRSRTKEKVGSGAVGGGEIETTEPALVRAIVRHGVLREPRWEKGKERGEEEQ